MPVLRYALLCSSPHGCCSCSGVERCIKVAAQAPVPGLQPGQDLAAFIDMLNAGLMNSTTCQATTEEDDHTGEHHVEEVFLVGMCMAHESVLLKPVIAPSAAMPKRLPPTTDNCTH